MIDFVTFHIKRKCYDKFKKYIIGNKKIMLSENDFIDILFLHNFSGYIRIDIPINNMIKFGKLLVKKNIMGKIFYDSELTETLLTHNLVDSLKYLIENTSVDHTDLLKDACKLSNKNTINFLLERLTNIDTFKIFVSECSNNNIEVIELFLEHLKDDEDDNNDFIRNINDFDNIQEFIKCDNQLILKIIASYGMDIASLYKHNRDDLLRQAITNNLINSADFLLDNGADIDLDYYDIEYCAKLNYIEAIDFLLDNYICLDQEYIDDLFISSINYSTEMIQLLIDNGANIKKYGKKVYNRAKKINNYHVMDYFKKS